MNKLAICVALLFLGGASWAAVRLVQDYEKLVPAPIKASAQMSSVVKHEVIDLGDGAVLRASVILEDSLLADSQGRPVSVSLNFVWNGGLMGSTHALREVAPTSNEPLSWDLYGLSPGRHDAAAAAANVTLGYVVSLRPVDHLLWGAIGDENQLIVEVTKTK